MAAFLFVFAPASYGAIRFDTIVGYNGVTPKNAWFPITCELQNDGPSFVGIIEISTDTLNQSQATRLRLELPSNTQKRVIIPVFSTSQYRTWNVRLLDEKGKVRSEPNYIGTRKTAGYPGLGVISRGMAGVPTLPEIKSRNPAMQPVAVRLQPELFPDNPIVLDGIPALYLSSERATQLSLPQANAILAWIQRGGHLIVGVDQVGDIASTDWLRRLLPCDLTSTHNISDHPGLQEWIRDYTAKGDSGNTSGVTDTREAVQRPRNRAATRASRPGRPNSITNQPQVEVDLNSLRDESSKEIALDSDFESAALPVVTGAITDGQILVGTPAEPLIIQAARGRGKITVLTFSAEREPFLSWKNRGWFWAKLTGVPANLYRSTDYINDYNRTSTDGIFGAMIETNQVRKLPLGWLLLLLTAYLVVIGPLDQYCLKRINRQMLTWVTFPIYVVAFSGLIYLIGFHLRAGDLEYNELNVVDVLPNSQLSPTGLEPGRLGAITGESSVLRGQTYCSIYSPANEHYTLAGEQAFAAIRGEYVGYGADLSSKASVAQRGNGYEADAFVSVWTSQLLVSDWLQPASLPLKLSVAPDGRDWVVTVENRTDRTFTRTHIVLANRIYEFDELPAQKTTTRKLIRDNGTFLNEFVNKNGAQLRAAADARRSSFRNSAGAWDLPVNAMAACFPTLLSYAQNSQNYATPEGLDLTSAAQAGYGILLAWDGNHSFAKPFNRFDAHRLHRNTLLRVAFPMQKSPES